MKLLITCLIFIAWVGINKPAQAASTLIVSDTFTGADAATLATHVGETGATWSGNTSGYWIIGNRLRYNGLGAAAASGQATGPDQSIEADIYVASMVSGYYVRLWCRGTLATNTYYVAEYSATSTTTGNWWIAKYVNNSYANIVGYSQGLTAGNTYHVKMQATGTQLTLWVDGVQRATTINTAIATGNQVGIRMSGATDTTGFHIDNFVAYDTPSLKSKQPFRYQLFKGYKFR